MKEQKIENLELNRSKSRLLNRVFIGLIILFTFAIYGNTIFNYYSLDDCHISGKNQLIKKGIKGIPDIFTSLYASEDGMDYGYRSLTRSSYAIEYEIFGENPYVSHFINVVLYLLVILILYKILKRLFRGYSLFFPFFITLLFLAHPVHTEVVASLKNRDELMNYGFCLLALDFLLKYADFKKIKFIIWGLFFYILAFLSKETAITFLFVFPLVLYFFTSLSPKKVLYCFLVLLGFGLISFILTLPQLYIPEFTREMRLLENPLSFDDNIWNQVGTGFYVLLYYLRLLVFPHPLLYFYGYNMVPVVNLANLWVLLSIVFHAGIFVIAVYKFRDKCLLSFIILLYLITVGPYSNILITVPGIIGERFLFVPSLPFCIFIVYLIFYLFRSKPETGRVQNKKLVPISAIIILLLIPYSVKTFRRNKDWNTNYSLYAADIKYLGNSVKANDLLATELIRQVNIELSKPVNVTKFLMPTINRAVSHWEKAVEIHPGHYSSWTNLGIVYNRIFKEHKKAIGYFEKALEVKPDHGKAIYNMGQAYEAFGNIDKAIELYEECIERDPGIINPRSRLSNVYFRMGEFEKAIILNQEIMKLDPNESLPYVNFGNYYFNIADTARAISFYEQAVEKGAPLQVSFFLAKFYSDRNNIEKANYYRQKTSKIRARN
ncbi:MAG: tetratricopeptide repeat protein [Bacteroidetes bacterium]|nr:tetratricopeptide repeat protein [Bacteroidota bacterium]